MGISYISWCDTRWRESVRMLTHTFAYIDSTEMSSSTYLIRIESAIKILFPLNVFVAAAPTTENNAICDEQQMCCWYFR